MGNGASGRRFFCFSIPANEASLLLMKDKKPWDQYHEYEGLDKILTAQTLRSAEAGDPVHDEMLFIVFHQIYELWFKQILFELDDIQKRFSSDVVDDHDMQPILCYLNRIVEIFRTLIHMIDVLETMPPQSFVDFRQYLGTGSGFQSWQFRILEMRLGLRRNDRIPVFHGEFDKDLRSESKKAIKAAEENPSLYDQIDKWLSRTPFVNREDYKFWEEYRGAVYKVFDEKEALSRKALSGEALEKELAGIESGRQKFDSIFEEDKHAEAQEKGTWRMSLKALQAALFITIYSHEPILQGPSQLLRNLVEIDELIARWRYRHALLVQRMVGMGAGTGGSSGYGYLMETLAKHRIYTDLFALSSYLIPTKSLPALPEQISRQMSYNYRSKDKAA